MEINEGLLNLLVCPENRTPLALAGQATIGRLNELIRARRLKNKNGQTVEQTMAGGLVREDQTLLYPIIDGIPVLLIDEAIPLGQLGQ